MRVPSWYKFVESLEDSFVLTPTELIHIKKVEAVNSLCHFQHKTYLYSEIQLVIEGTHFYKDGDIICKKNIRSIFFTIDTSKVIPVSKENLPILLTDEDPLIRHAASYWYKTSAA